MTCSVSEVQLSRSASDKIYMRCGQLRRIWYCSTVTGPNLAVCYWHSTESVTRFCLSKESLIPVQNRLNFIKILLYPLKGQCGKKNLPHVPYVLGILETPRGLKKSDNGEPDFDLWCTAWNEPRIWIFKVKIQSPLNFKVKLEKGF